MTSSSSSQKEKNPILRSQTPTKTPNPTIIAPHQTGTPTLPPPAVGASVAPPLADADADAVSTPVVPVPPVGEAVLCSDVDQTGMTAVDFGVTRVRVWKPVMVASEVVVEERVTVVVPKSLK